MARSKTNAQWREQTRRALLKAARREFAAKAYTTEVDREDSALRDRIEAPVLPDVVEPAPLPADLLPAVLLRLVAAEDVEDEDPLAAEARRAAAKYPRRLSRVLKTQ